MPSSFFFARLVPNRPNFVMTMTPEEQATMGAHAAFLLEAVHRLLEKDPAGAIGRYEILPCGPLMARPARA